MEIIDPASDDVAEPLFVDDRINDISAAHEMDIDSIVFDPRSGFAPIHR